VGNAPEWRACVEEDVDGQVQRQGEADTEEERDTRDLGERLGLTRKELLLVGGEGIIDREPIW